MPTYDYFCETNGRKVELSHRMSESVTTWGEVCQRAGLETGDTVADTPVRKLINGGAFISANSLSNPEPACSTGSCCAGGACGLPD